MVETIEIPVDLARFQLPEAVQARLQHLLDRQDAGELLTPAERQEAEYVACLSPALRLFGPEWLPYHHSRIGW